MPEVTARPPWLVVALVSGTGLALQVLLLRLLAIVQWHHLAYLVLSVALLGVGAAGSVVTVARGWLLARCEAVTMVALGLLTLAAPGAFLAVQRLPLNLEELLWDPAQPWWLALAYLLLAVPFGLVSLVVMLALARHPACSGRLYGADLLGAGAGALAAPLLLAALPPLAALAGLALLPATAMLSILWRLPGPGRGRLSLLALLAGALAVSLPLFDALRVSPYKGLVQLLRVPGTEVISERSGPLAMLSVVRSRQTPLRHAPGLSLLASAPLPEQLAVFVDADAPGAVARWDGESSSLAWLDWMTSALPYHLLAAAGRGAPSVAVLGAGGGEAVLQAIGHGAASVAAVEIDPNLVELLRGPLAAWSGELYRHPAVRVHVAEARAFALSAGPRFDLVQVPPLGGYGATGAGLLALGEDYLHTVEGLAALYGRVAPGGYLALTRWVRVPPRDLLRLLATATLMLREAGVAEPGRRLALLRGWQSGTLLVRRGEIGAVEAARLREFATARGFDPVWFPGMRPGEGNRHNRLAQPWFEDGARALLGEDAQDFIDRYRFDLRPARDDRPYFHSFFRWQSAPEILAARGRGGLALLEWGYVAVLATLVQALLAGVLLVLGPLLLVRRRGPAAGPARTRVLLHALALGLGFLGIEVVFLQRAVALLHHPVYAAAAVLALFLVCAGAGSLCSGRLADRFGAARTARLATLAVVLLALACAPLSAAMVEGLAGAGLHLRAAALAVMAAPLALLMGMPFPLLLRSLGEDTPALQPWAWAVNGCASVVAPPLATLLAVELGLSAVMVLSAATYLLAALSCPRTAAGAAR